MKQKKTGMLASVAMSFFTCAMGAIAAGFDGVPLTTNDWFDAGFTALTVDTPIVQGGTTGITRGAGSWTAVPATGTAVIAADADAGGEATLLSLSAPDEELTFTPAAFAATSGLETVSAEIKADAIDELPVIGTDVQAAFTVYLDENDVLSAQGWTAAGWTNLASAAASSLTNAWFTLYLDFAKEGGVRYVRYSVKPAAGALAVLADSDGTTWFQAGKNADVVSSVSFSGIGSVRAFSGDELEVLGVATYNGVAYQTFEAAIAAGIADSWAHGNVLLLADATWTPTATGAYNIDVNGYELTINGVNGTWSGTTYTVPATHWYWIGGASSTWADGANWSHFVGGAAAGAYPNSESDSAFFPVGATINLSNKIATVCKIFTDGDLTFLGDSTINSRIRTSPNSNNGKLYMGGAGKVCLAGVALYASYATSGAGGANEISNAVEVVEGTTNYVRIAGASDRYASIYLRGALSGNGMLIVFGNTDSGHYQAYFYGDASEFGGTLADHRDGDEYAARLNFMTAASLSSLATYNLAATYNAAGNNFVLRAGGTGTTYRMGALNGEVHFDGNRNDNSQQYYGYTLEIGGKNENCSFGGTLARNGYASYTKKVGTSDMTFTGSQIPNITIENGTYIVGAATALPDSMIFTGGAFSVADGVTVNPVASFSSESTAAVVFDDRGLDNTWTTLNDARVPYGFTKKGAGTLTLTVAPTHTTKTTIEEGTLVVPQGATIAELSLDGGKLTVPLTGAEDDTAILSITALAEGTDYDALTNAVAIPGATMTVTSDGGSGYIVKATRNPQTFTWSGAADTAWENGANWTVGGVVASTAPLAIDTAVVDAQAEISLVSTASISNLTLNAQTTFSGDQIMNVSEIAGAGLLRMAGIQIRNTTTTTLNFTNNVEVVAGSSNEFAVVTDNKNNARDIEIYGNITGTGHLTLRSRHSNNYYGVHLHGNNMDFAGEIYVYPYISDDKTERNNTYIDVSEASSSNAVWEVYSSSGSHSFLHNGVTAYFGALSGKVHQLDSNNHQKPTFEIGALPGLTSVLGGTYSRTNADRCSGEGATIRKVGETSVLKFSGVRAKQYQLNAGLFVLDGDSSRDFYLPADGIVFGGGTLRVDATNVVGEVISYADPSAKIVNSDSAIKIEIDGCVTQVWATALAASNVGGLVKKGEGTLTLTALPLYTGVTYLDGGALRVPLTWRRKVRTHVVGKHTESTVDGDYKVYTIVDGEAPAPTVMFLK